MGFFSSPLVFGVGFGVEFVFGIGWWRGFEEGEGRKEETGGEEGKGGMLDIRS